MPSNKTNNTVKRSNANTTNTIPILNTKHKNMYSLASGTGKDVYYNQVELEMINSGKLKLFK